ncbi:MAG: hypothetical protein P4M14_09665 [Gammaproteobacteria bacterium]|nr:hypothetical protein [Gammaproteobacteria bacterium]
MCQLKESYHLIPAPNTTSLWLTPPSMASSRLHKMIALLEFDAILFLQELLYQPICHTYDLRLAPKVFTQVAMRFLNLWIASSRRLRLPRSDAVFISLRRF